MSNSSISKFLGGVSNNQPGVGQSKVDIEALRQALKKQVLDTYTGIWHPLNEKFLLDECLNRYLKARNYDVGKSAIMIVETLKWRHEFKPDLISAREFEVHLKSGANYFGGYDREGRPIMVSRVRLDKNERNELKLRLMIYQVERCIRLMEGTHANSLIWLVDLRDFPSHLMYPTHINLTRSLINILNCHYPERLATGIAINVPSIFFIFWKMCSVFIDSNTAEKIFFFKSKELEKLKDVIDESIIEKDWVGGTSKYNYNHEKYWSQLMNEEDQWFKYNISIFEKFYLVPQTPEEKNDKVIDAVKSPSGFFKKISPKQLKKSNSSSVTELDKQSMLIEERSVEKIEQHTTSSNPPISLEFKPEKKLLKT